MALDAWAALLLPLGLSLNINKTGVWSAAATLPASLLNRLPPEALSVGGLTICGIPLAPEGTDAAEHDLPVGSPPFVQSFLEHKTAVFKRRLAALLHVVHTLGPNSAALQVTLHILQVGLQGYFVHLFRFLSPEVVRPWAAQLDTLAIAHLAEACQLPLHQPVPRAVLRAPMAQGGLNFLRLELEAGLHFLSGARALHDAPTPGPRLALPEAELLATVAHLQPYLNIDIPTTLNDHPPRPAAKRLRQALAEYQGQELRRHAPWLEPPGWHHDPPPNPRRLHALFANAWLIPRPGLLLFGGPFRYAMATYCGLPLFREGSYCTYTPASTGRPCSAPLGRHSHHVFSCAYAPRMQRHNAMRDAWAKLFKQAGWIVRIEQVVPTVSGMKRADLAATSPAGEELALDVMVTAPTALEGPAGVHLYDAARAKAIQI